MAGDGRGFDSWKLHAALVMATCSLAIYALLSKVAVSTGVNPFVFCLYRDCIGSFVLGTYAFFAERGTRPKLTLPVFGFMVCLGFFGIFIQHTLYFVGLGLAGVVLSSALQNCTPIFILVIALIFRLEEVRIGERHGQAKILGVLLCVLGAMALLFYKGPNLLPRMGLTNATLPQRAPPLSGEVFAELLQQWGISKWQIGALCIIGSSLSLAVYINLQVPALARYPAPISLMAGAVFSGTILVFLTVVVTVKDPSKWVLSGLAQIIPAIYAGTIISGVTMVLVCWSNHKGGPIFVGAYSPMSSLLSSILGYYFLGESIFLGWIIGAVVIICGLSLVTWGQHEHQQQRALVLEILAPLAPPTIQGVFPVKPASQLEDPLLG
ncbi:hypothetical protein BDL97_06G068800 [Sphagnum fallax]|nr:hypothetical protein BDL97_06G068800 [Sphagnum fallax]